MTTIQTFIQTLKPVFLGSVAFIALTMNLTRTGGTEAPESKSESKGKSIAELQQERLAVLQQWVKASSKAYRAGQVDVEGVIEAQQQLLNAKLEVAEDRQSRLKLLSESVQLAVEAEKIAEARYHTSQASQADVLQCRAYRLNAEIARQREQQEEQ